jgi:hypothetical protein
MFTIGYNDNKKVPNLNIRNVTPEQRKTGKYKQIKKMIDDGFCIFSFPRMFIYPDSTGKLRKEPVYTIHWSLVNRDNFLNYINFNDLGFSIIAGRLSGITVFDFDDAKSYQRLIKEHPNLKKCRTIKTNKGFHIYFKYNNNIQTRVDAMVSYNKVDIRNNHSLAFCPPCQYTIEGKKVEYKDLGGNLIEVPKYLIEDLRQFKEPQTTISNKIDILYVN